MFYRNNFEPKELHSEYGDAMDKPKHQRAVVN
jgi:hypothetical protein